MTEEGMEPGQNYKGHRLTFSGRKLDDGTWWCNCAVIRSGMTGAAGLSVDGYGKTEEEAQQQALKSAKERIDSITAAS
jgi:hypothetical protein